MCSQERLEELETLRTKLDVSFDMVSSLVDSWLPPPDPEEEAKEEKEELERQKELTRSIQERHAARIGMSGIKSKTVSEMTLKRKLTQNHSRKDDEDVDDVASYPIQKRKNLKRLNENDEKEEEEDSKTFIISKRSKLNSLCSKVDPMSDGDTSLTTAATTKDRLGGDFLSMYLTERDKKKKKSKNKRRKPSPTKVIQ